MYCSYEGKSICMQGLYPHLSRCVTKWCVKANTETKDRFKQVDSDLYLAVCIRGDLTILFIQLSWIFNFAQ